MRFKVIACMLAMASLFALASVAADDNEKKREKSARWRRRDRHQLQQ